MEDRFQYVFEIVIHEDDDLMQIYNDLVVAVGGILTKAGEREWESSCGYPHDIDDDDGMPSWLLEPSMN